MCYIKSTTESYVAKAVTGTLSIALSVIVASIVKNYGEASGAPVDEKQNKIRSIHVAYTACHAATTWYLGGKKLAQTALIPGIITLLAWDGFNSKNPPIARSLAFILIYCMW